VSSAFAPAVKGGILYVLDFIMVSLRMLVPVCEAGFQQLGDPEG
jgi:hypothetical protein